MYPLLVPHQTYMTMLHDLDPMQREAEPPTPPPLGWKDDTRPPQRRQTLSVFNPSGSILILEAEGRTRRSVGYKETKSCS